MALTAVLVAVGAGPAGALPPPPPNPSNSDITAAQAAANAKAAAVGQLANQLAAAQAKLADLQDQVEQKEEDANKALVDLQTAQDAAAQAQAAANASQIALAAAADQVNQLRGQVDQFVAGTFEQGSEVGSAAAYFGATSPKDMLERQLLLNAISDSELNVLQQMQQAQVAQANADSARRAALVSAQQKQAAATRAKQAADAAISAAESAQQAQAGQTNQLQDNENSVQAELTAAQAKVGDLRAQRAQYTAWLAAKQAAEAAAAAAARRAAGGGGGGGDGRVGVPGNVTGSIAAVLRRALAQLGRPYVWGGGTTSGPSTGVPGDPNDPQYASEVGFDCSGLMVYAFAAAGIYLPHFSGYQYTAGAHVPISAIQPGDMLFYSSDGSTGGIHHVTLYIGGGLMVEAYGGGVPVRVTPVRYYGGLLPYATRLL